MAGDDMMAAVSGSRNRKGWKRQHESEAVAWEALPDQEKLALFLERNAKASGTITLPPKITKLFCGCELALPDAPVLTEGAKKGDVLKAQAARKRVHKATCTKFQQVTRPTMAERWTHVCCGRPLLWEEDKVQPEAGTA